MTNDLLARYRRIEVTQFSDEAKETLLFCFSLLDRYLTAEAPEPTLLQVIREQLYRRGLITASLMHKAENWIAENEVELISVATTYTQILDGIVKKGR